MAYEGTKESPTHFIINDPDLGGQIRATKGEVEKWVLEMDNFSKFINSENDYFEPRAC